MATKGLTPVKNGDKAAFEKLLESYEVLIRSECSVIIRRNRDLESESEELLQEGRLALYNAAMNYDEKQSEVTFGLYAKICIRNRLISYVRKLSSAKRRRDKAAEKSVSDSACNSAEQMAIDFENSGKLRAILHDEASRYEEKVFILYLEKKSYEQIADTVGKDVKSVANAICRVKAKLKKRLK